jgi:prepilin-type N-terminal cleavage/methylation domain-containing protein
MARIKSIPSFMQIAKSKIFHPRSGFTLVELLTIVAIIAVLASLLLTAVASAKKKAQMMVCTSNLHQFTLALNMYMDDSGGKRPTVDELVTEKYLLRRSLICPEDKTGDWGRLVQENGMILASVTNAAPVKYSYLLYPLNWSDAEWKTLVNAGGRAGVAACQLHGLGNQNTPNVLNYSGLLLRAQLDGSVIRRQFFWSPLLNTFSGQNAVPSGTGSEGSNPYLPLEIFFDDPTDWQGYQ